MYIYTTLATVSLLYKVWWILFDKKMGSEKSIVLHSLSQLDDVWCSGVINGRSGIFPRNFVKLSENNEFHSSQNQTKVCYNNITMFEHLITVIVICMHSAHLGSARLRKNEGIVQNAYCIAGKFSGSVLSQHFNNIMIGGFKLSVAVWYRTMHAYIATGVTNLAGFRSLVVVNAKCDMSLPPTPHVNNCY